MLSFLKLVVSLLSAYFGKFGYQTTVILLLTCIGYVLFAFFKKIKDNHLHHIFSSIEKVDNKVDNLTTELKSFSTKTNKEISSLRRSITKVNTNLRVIKAIMDERTKGKR